MMIRFGSRFEDDHPKSWRERLRGAFTGLAGMPQAFRLVWEAHPSLTLALALATLLQAFIAPASAWVGKLTIDAVVAAIARSDASLSSVAFPIALGLGLAACGQGLRILSQFSSELLRDRLTQRINRLILDKTLTLDL